MSACNGAEAFVQSLMKVRPSGVCNGPTPTHAEVVWLAEAWDRCFHVGL